MSDDDNRTIELSKHEVMLLIGAVGKEVTASAGTVANEEFKCLYELLRDVYEGPEPKTTTRRDTRDLRARRRSAMLARAAK